MSSSSKAFRNEICRRFMFYMMRGSMSVGQAFEATLSDINSLQDTYFAEEVLIEQCVTLFASKYESLLYEGTHEPDPDNVFHLFASFEGLSSDLTETLATAIITNAAISATVDEGLITERLANSLVSINKGDEAEQTDDVSDADVVITKYWQALSKNERLNKVKAFLRKISKAHLNSRDLKPWLKDLNVGDQENPYGTKYGVTKTFDRSAHHFGHSPNEETELDEAKSGHVWDTMSGLVSVKVHKVEPDPNYPDHPGLRKAHIEVTSRNHKIYKKGERHETLASHIHPKSAIHRRSGIYRIWPHDPVGESKAIPNIDICQGLQEGYSNVNRYVEHINKNPFSLLSEPISKSSPASELKSVWRQKAAQQKLFGEQIDPRHHHRKPK